jgi:hypothetical protein
MDANEALAERFEEHRTRLRAVAYRMLGPAQRGRRRRAAHQAASAGVVGRGRVRTPHPHSCRGPAALANEASSSPRTGLTLLPSW